MEWKYYNHAMIPDCAPHEIVDISEIQNGNIWKSEGGRPLFARWTSDFDCEDETEWWYVIKDNEYKIETLKAKRRYEITKARRNFDVKQIEVGSYVIADAISDIREKYYSKYQASDGFNVTREDFRERFKKWKGIVFGAFYKDENGEVSDIPCGYAHLRINGECIEFLAQKVKPEYETKGINAALVDGILTYFNEDLLSGKYILDGARNINHKTAFQDYLEKYFGFRKAYCKLNIAYRPILKPFVSILYHFRGLLKRFEMFHKINSVLAMEEIKRKCKKCQN